MPKKDQWRRTIVWLRREFSLSRPVSIRSRPLVNWHAHCCLHRNRFEIRISSKDSYSVRVNNLLHEWAHCMTWFGASREEEPHSDEWGLAYAKLYRAHLKLEELGNAQNH